MKKLFAILCVALIQDVDARKETRKQLIQKVKYDKTLNCGMCISGGYNFCWKQDVPGKVLNDKQYPIKNKDRGKTQQICCENNEDWNNCRDIVVGDGNKQKQWICSYSYNTPAYSFHVCPFKRSSCGPNSKINFYQKDDDGAIHIQNLKEGDACVYNVESVCGAPSFKVTNSTGVNIFFAEWQQDRVSQNTPVTKKQPGSQEMKAASPIQGMPSRGVKFDDEKTRTEHGIPSFGEYAKKAWRTWGNKIQNGTEESMLGRRYNSVDNECKLRNVLVSVVARNESAQLLLEVQSQSFQAVYIKNAVIMAFGALSIYASV